MAELAPIFTTARLYVEPRPWSSRITTPESWVGTGGALVRRDVADPRMLESTYGEGCEKGRSKPTDADVQEKIDSVCSKAAVFHRRGKVKRKYPETDVTVELAFYESSAPAQDTRVFLVDTALGGAPDRLYAAAEGLIGTVVNSIAATQVTLVIAPYMLDDNNPTFRRVLRKLGRQP